MAKDEELAVHLAKQPDTNDEPDPGFAEWDATRELLAITVDLLGELLAVTVAVNSSDHNIKHPKPVPRPKRALDTIIAKHGQQMYESLLADLERARAKSDGGG